MKYLITESQLDNIIFKYLDSLKFFALKDAGDIYLYPSETHWREHLSYAIIAFHIKYRDCYVSCSLITEISNIFSTSLEDSLNIVKEWFEYNYDVKIGKSYSDCGSD
jgi:hypothetical protein